MPDDTSYVHLVKYDDPFMPAYNPRAINHYIDVHNPIGDFGPDVRMSGSSSEIIQMQNEGMQTVTINGAGPNWQSALLGKARIDVLIGSTKFELAQGVAITIPRRVADFLRQQGWIR